VHRAIPQKKKREEKKKEKKESSRSGEVGEGMRATEPITAFDGVCVFVPMVGWLVGWLG